MILFSTSDNTAILIQNVIDGSQDLEIRSNLIEKIADGIFLRNVGNINLNPSNVSDIFDNEIKFGVIPNTATGFYYGIRLENSIGFSITDNTISKQNPVNPDAIVVDNLRGISLSKSPNNIVADNTITKMGAGIRAIGSCPNSTLACNDLDRNYFGFKFEGPADISDQLPGQIPTGNIWTTLPGPASDMDINLNDPIDWFYPQNGYNPDWTGAPLSFNNGTGTTPTPFSEICNQFSIQPPIDDREIKLGKIIRSEKNFTNFPDEFNLNDKLFASRFLKENPTYLSLGTIDDSTYQNFMNSCNGSCIGKFNKVHEYIELNDYSNALNENSGIAYNIGWEYNLKRVNEIYLNNLISDTISQMDSTELNDIAWQNVLDGGPGVTMARSILNLDIEDVTDGTTRSKFEIEEVTESTENSILVYPNPSNGEFTIESDSSFNNTDLIVKDITGKIVYSNNISLDENRLSIDLNLPPGVYMLSIKNKDEWIMNHKIVIE